jgi:hypothetical protein
MIHFIELEDLDSMHTIGGILEKEGTRQPPKGSTTGSGQARILVLPSTPSSPGFPEPAPDPINSTSIPHLYFFIYEIIITWR